MSSFISIFHLLLQNLCIKSINLFSGALYDNPKNVQFKCKCLFITFLVYKFPLLGHLSPVPFLAYGYAKRFSQGNAALVEVTLPKYEFN